jgi:hypothetical protein
MQYHGTRLNDPQNFYEGQEGFDMRLSPPGGMWGLASCFAVIASYSDTFHHQVAKVESSKVNFLCEDYDWRHNQSLTELCLKYATSFKRSQSKLIVRQ